MTRPPQLSGLPDRYLPLYGWAVEVLTADDRVRAVWLHGACGRGAADAGSDPAAQRETLAALPVPTADRAACDHARDVAIAAFLREARLIAAANAVPWPTDLEVAVRGFLASEGFELRS